MKPLLYVIIALLVIVIVVVVVLINKSPSETTPEPTTSETIKTTTPEISKEPTPPAAPSSISAEAISTSTINIYWSDNSDNEDGFKVYRDGSCICNLPANTTSYEDTNLKQATTYQYRVTAFNQKGETTTSATNARTPNPPIRIKLNRIGVHDNGEDFIRDNDGGEIYIGIVITDGNKTVEQKLPLSDGQFFTLYDDDFIDIDTIIYSTNEAGDYLRIAILGYESDGGTGETLLYEALGTAANAYLTGGVGTILGVDLGLGDIVGRLFGGDDDFLGAYEKAWGIEHDWGSGIYSDVPCYMDEETIGLRLWFTIEAN